MDLKTSFEQSGTATKSFWNFLGFFGISGDITFLYY
jgi:hypothetical protein